ncbi:hypothetical protein B7P43_G09556 [Cryptotermes secundus]|uniref:Mos1 transposase HTH domain-containing protein n=1 Tax=Cryptotermes secundus TaxID=105785 RepID=A0A2J7RSK3_9NEOP|nr:hypothetical protein B7P43_G09556 [Cryptotermes secundus]
MNVSQLEQCCYMKIAVLRGRTVTECHSELVEALGDHALLYRTVARWIKSFQCGREASTDLQCSGHPVSVRTNVSHAVIAQRIEEDRRWSLKRLERHTGIDQATVHQILRNLYSIFYFLITIEILRIKE